MTALPPIRKRLLLRETVVADAHGRACDPITRVAAIAVVANPFAGRFEQDLTPLFELARKLGPEMAEEAVAALAGPPVSYGKAALVGVAGDMEHGGALIHPRLGAPMRAAAGGGAALIPSNAKIGAAGAVLDVPLGHKDEAWSFAHFDTLTVCVADAPLPNEILFVAAFADGGRPHPRVGTGPMTD
ncbi:amino acid synthesis family protein [Albimonas sp. CAU 1670]|uniref:amino acid synthesis family protein n=1 Tax=Albimonas sp. CAU 1670 TaxID=3032599 RepID=UPI0023DA8300|nr:amino acid synthesis family protein [Albimonas sp. CAU 1670]MDF2234255.1 amino acid synthesis family protein [Albimonas sp. CAU 1670]